MGFLEAPKQERNTEFSDSDLGLNPSVKSFTNYNLPSEIVAIFTEAGYAISDRFSGRDGEIGCHSDTDLQDDLSRTDIIGARLGILVPRRIDLSSVSSIPFPVVIKIARSNRGEGIIFITSQQDLLLWNARHFMERFKGRYVAREYIECPSRHYASFRILTDAHGQVHAVSLLYSQHTKDEKAKKIVSNKSQGGNEIRLNGQAIVDKVEREVLWAHGLDPDSPFAPELMVESAEKIGRECRGIYPYVGADFIMRKSDLSFFFLEANACPMVDPEDIGLVLDSDFTPLAGKFYPHHLELFRRVAVYQQD